MKATHLVPHNRHLPFDGNYDRLEYFLSASCVREVIILILFVV